MMDMEIFDDLMHKINPGQIDFFQATIGTNGSKGTICEVVDAKAIEIIESRVKMGQPPVVDSDVTGEDPNDEAAKKRKVKLLLSGKINNMKQGESSSESSSGSGSNSGSGSSGSGSDDD